MERNSRLRPLLGLLTVEVAAVVTLHRLGRVDGLAVPHDDATTWARLATTEELVGAGLRMVGLVVAWWLLATTVAYFVAVAARRDRLAAAVRLLTLPAIRRRVDRALAVTALAGASLFTPAAALAQEPPPTPPPSSTGATVPVIELDRRPPRDDAPPVPEVRGGRAVDQPVEQPAEPPPSAPTTTAPPAPAPIPPTAPAEPVVPTPLPVPASPDEPTPANHVVEPGESLWTIAAAHLSASGTEALSEQDIAGYWRTLVDANRSTLRSGNPNLIYPGEVVALPPSSRTS